MYTNLILYCKLGTYEKVTQPTPKFKLSDWLKITTNFNFRYEPLGPNDIKNVWAYISKDVIANFNFSMPISAKIIAQKTGIIVGFWNFDFYGSLTKENQYFLCGRTLSCPKSAMEIYMKFYCHYSVKQWLTLRNCFGARDELLLSTRFELQYFSLNIKQPFLNTQS